MLQDRSRGRRKDYEVFFIPSSARMVRCEERADRWAMGQLVPLRN